MLLFSAGDRPPPLRACASDPTLITPIKGTYSGEIESLDRDVIEWQWKSVTDTAFVSVTFCESSCTLRWCRSIANTILLSSYTYPFNGRFSGTTWVSPYQKVETNLDFTEARDNEWQRHQLRYMQVCTSLQTDNHASTPPLSTTLLSSVIQILTSQGVFVFFYLQHLEK